MEDGGSAAVEFNAAGLMVPDPSISSFPMPLSGLETGGVVRYMAPGQRAVCEAAEGRFGAALPDRPGCRRQPTCEEHTTIRWMAAFSVMPRCDNGDGIAQHYFGMRWLAGCRSKMIIIQPVAAMRAAGAQTDG